MVQFKHTMKVNNEISKVYDLLVDYDFYPELVPEIKRVQVLSRRGTHDTVQFTGRLIKRVCSTLRLKKVENREISWSQVEGDFLLNRGSWRLDPAGEDATEVEFNLVADMGALVPMFVVNMALNFSMPRMMRKLKREAESLGH